MKSKIRFYLGMLLITLLVSPAFAEVSNVGFETGTTTDWQLYIPDGGSARVVHSHVGSSTVYAPVSGLYFLELKTDGPGSYTSAIQQVVLTASETIDGYAAFDCRENEEYDDDAYVEVLDVSGAVIGTPWSESCGSTGYSQADTPWTYWSFTAQESGTYVLSYRVANEGDGAVAAYALFDGDQEAIPIPPVPALNGLGLMMLILLVTGIGWVAIRRF